MNRFLIVRVDGIPKSAGSKNAFYKNGKVIVVDTCKNKEWKDMVAYECEVYMRKYKYTLFNKPMRMFIDFLMPIPKTKIKQLKGGEKHTKKPDLTKLVRCAEDAMTGIVYTDDSLIVEQHVKKYYSTNPGALIKIQELTTSKENENE